MADAISALDYFKDVSTELDSKYDFNKDGTVDIADYQIARVYLSDNTTAEKIQFSQAELDIVFNALIEADEDTNKYANINEETANGEAEEIIKAVNSGATNPENAETLDELQTIGATLTKYIKECADLSKILAAQIPILKNELDELEEEKEAKQREYDTKASQVEAKTQELDKKLISILDKSNKMTSEFENKCNRVVNKCIEDYKNGSYSGQSLATIIMTQLAIQGGANTTDLKREINNSTAIGIEIKRICGDIEDIAADIRDVTQRYNSKNVNYNRTVNNRNDILKCSQTASVQYQKGYAVRQVMRQEIIDQYKVDGDGTVVASNPQLQKMAEFLEAKELDNMPYADAWNILKATFDNCGITFNDSTHTMAVPKGHDASSTNIYNALVQSIYDNYRVNSERTDVGYEDEDDGDGKPIDRNDPMSFTNGNIKYEFISDNNGNGKFDDRSEFLGADKGWDEMVAYDADGNGIISGNELNALKMVAVDQTTGQYTFTNANLAGIDSINLKAYKEINEKQNNNDILSGTFEINVGGEIITGTHTLDSNMNIDNKYSTLFGTDIKNQEEMYAENPFMAEFQDAPNISNASSNIDSDIAITDSTATSNLVRGQVKAQSKAITKIEMAKIEQRRAEAKEEAKKENAETNDEATNNETSAAQSVSANNDGLKKSKLI